VGTCRTRSLYTANPLMVDGHRPIQSFGWQPDPFGRVRPGGIASRLVKIGSGSPIWHLHRRGVPGWRPV
jgi:hypothetical protein